MVLLRTVGVMLLLATSSLVMERRADSYTHTWEGGREGEWLLVEED